MRTSFNGSRSDPRAIVYARATIDLGSRDVRIEDVPCGNLEELGAAEIGTPVGPGDDIDIVPAQGG
jgi:hypothetical protein